MSGVKGRGVGGEVYDNILCAGRRVRQNFLNDLWPDAPRITESDGYSNGILP